MTIVNGRLFGSIPAGELVTPEFNSFLRRHVASAAAYGGPAYWTDEPNRFYVPATTDGSTFLTSDGVGKRSYLLNVCAHYHRPVHLPDDDWTHGYMGSLAGGRSHCGGHKWGYDAEGIHHAPVKLRIERGDGDESEKNCTNLHTAVKSEQRITTVGGLVWVGTPTQLKPYEEFFNLSLAQRNNISHFVPPNYRLVRVWVDKASFSAFTGMVIYEDLNHPGKGVHPGKLDCVVSMQKQERDYLPELGISLQIVPWVREPDYSKMNRYWREYHAASSRAELGGIVDHTCGKVAWIADYNGFFTCEQYPHFIVNSWFIPVPGGVRNVVEFYVPEEVLARFPELADAAIAAYMGEGQEPGIAQEDARLALGCDKGMKILTQHGKGAQTIGPLDPVSDRAVYDFHKFMAARWEADIATNPQVTL